MDKYVVYFGYVDSEIVYIGSGLKGREMHLNSGVTHVYAANKYHFEGKFVHTKIVWEGDSKSTALRIERELIREHLPRWNTTKPSIKSVRADPTIVGRWFWYKLIADYIKTSPVAVLSNYIIRHRIPTSNTVLMPIDAAIEYANFLTMKAGGIPDDYRSSNTPNIIPFVQSVSYDESVGIYSFMLMENFMEIPGMYNKWEEKVIEDHNRWNKEPITT